MPKTSKGRGGRKRQEAPGREEARQAREVREAVAQRELERDATDRGMGRDTLAAETGTVSTDEELMGPSDPDESGPEGNSTGLRTKTVSYSFEPHEEEKLVEWFSQNDCFYNKTSGGYNNQGLKRKLAGTIAKEMKCSSEYNHFF